MRLTIYSYLPIFKFTFRKAAKISKEERQAVLTSHIIGRDRKATLLYSNVFISFTTVFKQTEERLFNSLRYFLNFCTEIHLDMVTNIDTYFDAGLLFEKLMKLIRERNQDRDKFPLKYFNMEIDLSIKLCRQLVLPFLQEKV